MQQALASGAPQPADDRTHAALAHLLGAMAGLVSGGMLLPVAAPTLVLLFHSRRNPFVLFHVNQAAWFQGVISLVQITMAVVTGVLSFVTCGFGAILLVPFIPVFLLAWLAAVALPVYLALRAYEGQWTGYPWLGDWVLDQESPIVAD